MCQDSRLSVQSSRCICEKLVPLHVSVSLKRRDPDGQAETRHRQGPLIGQSVFDERNRPGSNVPGGFFLRLLDIRRRVQGGSPSLHMQPWWPWPRPRPGSKPLKNAPVRSTISSCIPSPGGSIRCGIHANGYNLRAGRDSKYVIRAHQRRHYYDAIDNCLFNTFTGWLGLTFDPSDHLPGCPITIVRLVGERRSAGQAFRNQ